MSPGNVLESVNYIKMLDDGKCVVGALIDTNDVVIMLNLCYTCQVGLDFDPYGYHSRLRVLIPAKLVNNTRINQSKSENHQMTNKNFALPHHPD